MENVPLGRGGREFKAVDKAGGEKRLRGLSPRKSNLLLCPGTAGKVSGGQILLHCRLRLERRDLH